MMMTGIGTAPTGSPCGPHWRTPLCSWKTCSSARCFFLKLTSDYQNLQSTLQVSLVCLGQLASYVISYNRDDYNHA